MQLVSLASVCKKITLTAQAFKTNFMSPHTWDDFPLRLAYNSLYNFFDVFPLPYALKRLEQLIYTACSKHYWRNGSPADGLFFMEHLQELCSTAIQLYHNTDAKLAAIDAPGTGMPDILQQAAYVYPKFMLTPWECMPRHLSTRQYHEPCRALAKFVQLMPGTKWQAILKELLEFALSNDSIEGCIELSVVLKVRKRLLQVVEACHLILVRVQAEVIQQESK